MKTKIISMLALCALLIVGSVFVYATSEEETSEPIYVGADFFIVSTCDAGLDQLTGGCEYYCGDCPFSGYRCNAFGSCC